jgi:hypothetical protein
MRKNKARMRKNKARMRKKAPNGIGDKSRLIRKSRINPSLGR